MNEYDSNRLSDLVKKVGYETSEDPNNIDCYILNTCHIREKATEKVYHDIGRLKKIYRGRKKPIVIITGCVAQAENKVMIEREPYIDSVVGPQSYHELPKIISEITSKNKKINSTDFDVVKKFDKLNTIKNTNSNISSFITIQEGCDKFCNFCVVPYTRGPEYSRPFKEIINEAKNLADNGVKEVILLGQNVNAYKDENYRLSNLILEIEKIPKILRIRYTTSHPKDMTDDLIEVYGMSKKLMPLVHLPVQSGSDKVLKLMNRKHVIKDYLKIYERLKKINSSIEFSSDFLIAYPGEDKNAFEATLNLIKKIKFINSFSFIFSPRPGTVASNLKLIERKASLERLKLVQKELFNNQLEMNRFLKNKVINVLVENKMDKSIKFFGRSEYMTPVIFDSNYEDVGKIIKVKITNSNQNTLFGERVEKSNLRVA